MARTSSSNRQPRPSCSGNASSGATGHDESESMDYSVFVEAQRKFQTEVIRRISEIESAHNIAKSAAVKILLERIAGKFCAPSAAQVAEMVNQYGVTKEDAIRALVVRDELQRLRRGGLDTLAAIREITNRLQRQAPGEAFSKIMTSSSARQQRTSKRDRSQSVANKVNGSARAGSISSDLNVVVEAPPVSHAVKRLKVFTAVGCMENDAFCCSLIDKKETKTNKVDQKKEKLAHPSSSSSTRVKQRANQLEPESLKCVRGKQK